MNAALILAAGFGMRLAPLTNSTPKPLLLVGGRPVVSHLVDRMVDVDGADGVDAIVVVVNARHLDQWQRWEQEASQRAPVRLVCNEVSSPGEQRGAVADMALGLAAVPEADRWLVMAGDNLLLGPVVSFLRHGRECGEPVVVCRDLGDRVPPGRFGEVTVDDGGLIARFREKPDRPASPLVATCTYVLPGEDAGLVADYLRTGAPDSPGGFIAWLAERRPVHARVFEGEYHDIGSLETLRAARAALG